MKHQVTLSEYTALASWKAPAARPSACPSTSDTNLPVTGVNYDDAQAYARWLSEKTGEYWTLPIRSGPGVCRRQELSRRRLRARSTTARIRPSAGSRTTEREAASSARSEIRARSLLGSFGENEYGLPISVEMSGSGQAPAISRVNLYDNGPRTVVQRGRLRRQRGRRQPHRSPTSSLHPRSPRRRLRRRHAPGQSGLPAGQVGSVVCAGPADAAGPRPVGSHGGLAAATV
jgi:hypothetical protein